MQTLILTSEQISLIQSALRCVMKKGGGNPTFSLYCEIARQSGIEDDIEDVSLFASNVIAEAREAGEI